MNTLINEDVQRRILGAADALYSEDSTSFPTVDAVRRRARANMADTVSVMRDWRRGKSPTQSSVTAEVPEKLYESARQLLSNLWLEAQAAANENLRTAHLGWELERQEAEAVRQQITAAFDEQALELDVAAQRISELEAARLSATRRMTDLQSQVDNLLRENAISTAANEATQRQFEQRIEDLKFAVSQGRTSDDVAGRRKSSAKATDVPGNGRANDKDGKARSSNRTAGRKDGSP